MNAILSSCRLPLSDAPKQALTSNLFASTLQGFSPSPPAPGAAILVSWPVLVAGLPAQEAGASPRRRYRVALARLGRDRAADPAFVSLGLYASVGLTIERLDDTVAVSRFPRPSLNRFTSADGRHGGFPFLL